MRVLTILAVAAVAALASVDGAAALEGGLGFQPPPFLVDPFQPARDKPYAAVCLAPPASCPVRYEYPIRAGKPCWCREGVFVYSGGVTQPPVVAPPQYVSRPVARVGHPVYKD